MIYVKRIRDSCWRRYYIISVVCFKHLMKVQNVHETEFTLTYVTPQSLNQEQ
jgi:hypothetical protein